MSEPAFTPETLAATLEALRKHDLLRRVHILQPGRIEFFTHKDETPAQSAKRRAKEADE